MDQKTVFVPGRIRAQLLAAGVPAWKHTPDGLLGLFPREFNVGAIGLDAHDLAEVLLHLVTRGVVTISATGTLTSIRKVEPGWHFCQFYAMMRSCSTWWRRTSPKA